MFAIFLPILLAQSVAFAQNATEKVTVLNYETVSEQGAHTRTTTLALNGNYARLDIKDNGFEKTICYDRHSRTLSEWDRARNLRRTFSPEEVLSFREKGRGYAERMRGLAAQTQNGTPQQMTITLQKRNPGVPIFWLDAAPAPSEKKERFKAYDCTVGTVRNQELDAYQVWSARFAELGMGKSEAALAREFQEILFEMGMAINGFRLSDALFTTKGQELSFVVKAQYFLDGATEATTLFQNRETKSVALNWLTGAE